MKEGGEITKTLDYSLCIICQTKSEDDLVENPVSHETVLGFIESELNMEIDSILRRGKR